MAAQTSAPIISAPGIFSPSGAAGKVRWPEHRDALARHEQLWAQDGLTFFSAARI
jgi:hypothetical protein